MGCGESKAKNEKPDLSGCEPAMGRNSLHMAAMQGKTEAVKYYLAQGIDPNGKGGVDGNTALHFIVMANHKDQWHEETAKALIEGGADPQETNNDGSTVLQYAQDFGANACAKGLRAMGAREEPNCADCAPAMGRNELHMAAMNGNTACVKYYLSQGMDPNAKGGVDGNTALHFIVMANRKDQWYEETARALIEGGADTQATNDDGSTVLEYAQDFGANACAKGLRAMGAH